MQDLSARYSPPGAPLSLLVPSSQEGGNLIQADLAARTMTAPGSEPVSPLPPALDGAHPTPTQSGSTIEVSHPGMHPRVAVRESDDGDADDGGPGWADDRKGRNRVWRQAEAGV